VKGLDPEHVGSLSAAHPLRGNGLDPEKKNPAIGPG
jgi:hypothetical protein